MATANYQQVIRTYFINLYEGIIYLVVSLLSTSHLLPLFSFFKKKNKNQHYLNVFEAPSPGPA